MGSAATGVTIPHKFTARYLRRFQLTAQTVFDVGVYCGTPELYKLFAGRRLVLIDPLEETRDEVRARSPELFFDFIPVALGSADGTAILNMTENPAKTGIPERTPLTADRIIERRIVPVTTLDRVVADGDFAEPFGLKIDAEGYELEILRGAEKALKRTEFVIAEVSVKKRFVGGYRFSDVVAFLGAHDFELGDILNFHGGVARFYDCLFLRRDHPSFDGPVASRRPS